MRSIEIPHPFPRQQISGHAEPIEPFIVLGRSGTEPNIFLKVVAVRDTGGMMEAGYSVEWGSLILEIFPPKYQTENRKHRATTGSYDPNDPIVLELNRKGLLIPRSDQK